MNMKLAICLQVSPLDVWLGLRLTRLLVKIEPEKRRDITFIVSARRDTNKPAVDEILATAKTKFPSAHVIRCKRFGTGWPHGCNDLWQETMMRCAQGYDAGHIQTDGVLTFESDCIPLRPDWLDRLAEEWREARARGKFVCGHAHAWDAPGASIGDSIGSTETQLPATHINGNAIFHAKVSDFYPELNGCDARQGWDAYHGKLLLSIGVDSPFIYQRYRLKDGFDGVRGQKIDRTYIEAIRKDDEIPALFHGIKQDYGLAVIESMVEDGSFFARIPPNE